MCQRGFESSKIAAAQAVTVDVADRAHQKSAAVVSTAAVSAGNRTDQREIPKSFKQKPANQVSNGGL